MPGLPPVIIALQANNAQFTAKVAEAKAQIKGLEDKTDSADLATVARGLTTAMTDYHIPASRANAVTSAMVATVAAGSIIRGRHQQLIRARWNLSHPRHRETRPRRCDPGRHPRPGQRPGAAHA